MKLWSRRFLLGGLLRLRSLPKMRLAPRIIRRGRSPRLFRSLRGAPATSSAASCSTACRNRWANRSLSRIGLAPAAILGTADAAKAAPDGYTLLGGGSGPVAANVTLYNHLDYDPQQDFETISPFAAFTIVVAVTSKLPINTLQELIAYAKAHPGELNYGSVGIGSSQHLAGEYFSQLTGVKITHMPYKNIGQYVPDLMSGGCSSASSGTRTSLAALAAKGAKALAVAGAQSAGCPAGTPRRQGSRACPITSSPAGLRCCCRKARRTPIVTKLNNAR